MVICFFPVLNWAELMSASWTESLWFPVPTFFWLHFVTVISFILMHLFQRPVFIYYWAAPGFKKWWEGCEVETHLVCFVCNSRVVFDLPETLCKAFPLLRFSKLLLMFIIREQILGRQECPAEMWRQVNDSGRRPCLTILCWSFVMKLNKTITMIRKDCTKSKLF